MTTPPDYLDNKVALSASDSPADLLQDGQWCGHGEPEFSVFDVQIENENVFSIQLPYLNKDNDNNEFTAPVVIARSDSGVTFPLYDSRKHPASMYSDDVSHYEPSPLQDNFHCPNCDKQKFNIAVGFEIPGDCIIPNDTSWFALAVKCVACQWKEIIFDDETA